MQRPSTGARSSPGGFLPLALLALLGGLVTAQPVAAQQEEPAAASGARRPAAAAAPARPGGPDNRIVAVVNSEVISRADIISRTRLFALNAGVAVPPDMMARLEAQVTRLLIDERVRMQEVQRRRIPVNDQDVAEAVRELEGRNNLPVGAMRMQLGRVGIQPRVLFDQIRTQIGWARLLRQQLGPQAEPTEQEVADAVRNHQARVGQPEFLVSEIFIPLDDPRNEAETQRFVEEVIGQLRRGVPFTLVATQFSQSQSAVQGGDLGWIRKDEVDAAAASILERMPIGAVSNPIRVPGGFQVVTLRGKRETGREIATVLSVRQAFFPFAQALDPNNPTAQQRDALERAQRLSAAARSCEQVEQAAPRGGDRPVDPGPIRLEGVAAGPLRSLLGGLAPGRASQPLITPEGILIVMVCSRESKNLAELTPDQAKQQILRDRLENLSRQLQRDLRRRAMVDMRANPTERGG